MGIFLALSRLPLSMKGSGYETLTVQLFPAALSPDFCPLQSVASDTGGPPCFPLNGFPFKKRISNYCNSQTGAIHSFSISDCRQNDSISISTGTASTSDYVFLTVIAFVGTALKCETCLLTSQVTIFLFLREERKKRKPRYIYECSSN